MNQFTLWFSYKPLLLANDEFRRVANRRRLSMRVKVYRSVTELGGKKTRRNSVTLEGTSIIHTVQVLVIAIVRENN